MSLTSSDTSEPLSLQCMEIWGGNQRIDNALSVAGIDAWVFSEPCAGEAAGGDIHYISMCGRGKISRFAVADVAGHGAEVADISDKLRALMLKYINTLDQTRFAGALNEAFSRLASSGTFATALLTTYYAPTDHLVICNAGHPPPLWYRAPDRKWQFLTADVSEQATSLSNLPLGVVEPTDYRQFAVGLSKGDLVLLHTDSLIEARHPDKGPLGSEGLLEMVRTIDLADPGRFKDELLERLATYRDGQPAEDDVTLVVLHHNASDPPRMSPGQMVKTVGKMLGLVKV